MMGRAAPDKSGSLATVGRAFVNGFDDPRTFFPWLADPAEADRFIAGASE